MKYLEVSPYQILPTPRVVAIWAFKGLLLHDCNEKCKRLGHYFRHVFDTPAFLYRLADGGFLVSSAERPPKKVSLVRCTKIYERTDKIQIRRSKRGSRRHTLAIKENLGCILGLRDGSFIISKA